MAKGAAIIGAALLFSASAQAYTITRVTIAFTNTIFGTSNYMTLTCNSDVRTWTNSVFVPTSQILTNSTQAGSATSLLNHLGLTPFSGVGISQTAATNVVLIGGLNQAMTVSVSAGWATLSSVTSTYGVSNISVVVPDSYVATEKVNVYSGLQADINSSSNTNKFSQIQVTTSPTNWVMDCTTTLLQQIVATNDVNIQFITNGPGLVWLEILPNGADRLLTVPTNWVMLNTNAWRRSGQYWASTVTNLATTGTGPRRFLMKIFLDDSASSQTNVIAEGFLSPSPNTATTGSGTVTSVDIAVPAEFSISGDPITTSGTMTIGKANETANTVWAGPTSGGAAAPTFRALVTADMPANVTANTLAAGSTINASDGSALTNLTLTVTTNSINTGTFTAGKAYETNFSGNITLGSFAGIPSNLEWFIDIRATNSDSAVHTVTFPSGCVGSGDGIPPVCYVTNGNVRLFHVIGWGNKATNVSHAPFY